MAKLEFKLSDLTSKFHYFLLLFYFFISMFWYQITWIGFIYLYFRESRILPREGNGTPLQNSCVESPMNGGAWWVAVHGVAESQTLLSDFTFTFMHWRRKWQPTPVFLPGEFQGRGAWWPAIYRVHRIGHDWSSLAAAGAVAGYFHDGCFLIFSKRVNRIFHTTKIC